jgi:glutathionyl-hydroquinone reductase
MNHIDKLDNLNSLIDQAKAIVSLSATHKNLDTLSPEVLSNLFYLLGNQLTEMDRRVTELSEVLLPEGGDA